MDFQNCAFYQHKTHNFACYAFNSIRSRIVRFTNIRSLQEPPGRPPGGPGPRPDGPKRRPEGGKKKLKSVQEGLKTRQEGKMEGPMMNKFCPRSIRCRFNKYFFTLNVKKYWIPFLDHFWPSKSVYFYSIFGPFLYNFFIIFYIIISLTRSQKNFRDSFVFIFFQKIVINHGVV